MESLFERVQRMLGEDAYAIHPLVYYKGAINHGLLNSIADTVEAQLLRFAVPSGISKRAYHFSIELMQNVHRHAAVKAGNPWNGEGFYALDYDGETIEIVTCNPVWNRNISVLTDLIDSLNACADDAVQSLFMVQLAGGTLSDKGGAGLGLIDIARKSQRPIVYHFKPICDDISLFSIAIALKKSNMRHVHMAQIN